MPLSGGDIGTVHGNKKSLFPSLSLISIDTIGHPSHCFHVVSLPFSPPFCVFDQPRCSYHTEWIQDGCLAWDLAWPVAR